MSLQQMRDVSAAVLTSMTEEECADWYRKRGTHVIRHRDRYWKETIRGFYQPLHWLARLSVQEANSPTPLSWGFQTTLSEVDAIAANASMPIHWLPNLENYDFQSMTSNRRNQLRKCYKRVNIVHLDKPTLLQQQGYEVFMSALKRTAYRQIPAKKDYLRGLAGRTNPERRLILAGVNGEQLLGYITGHAVNSTAYIDEVIIASEALSTNIGTGLLFEFAQVCRRSGLIRELVNGLHSREDENLCVFKEGMGFQVKHIPAKVQMNPIIEQFIQWRYPHKYYRLVGRQLPSHQIFTSTQNTNSK
ncbi:GNAT family N-acetyltransferase [Nostoc sp. CCY 9925]|uniref:GNAT family N-acetyltransferase n=1 Tax=Nostoc sp. CCY 9925 TaxID=3103865 RepID=UPI0039C75659